MRRKKKRKALSKVFGSLLTNDKQHGPPHLIHWVFLFQIIPRFLMEEPQPSPSDGPREPSSAFLSCVATIHRDGSFEVANAERTVNLLLFKLLFDGFAIIFKTLG